MLENFFRLLSSHQLAAAATAKLEEQHGADLLIHLRAVRPHPAVFSGLRLEPHLHVERPRGRFRKHARHGGASDLLDHDELGALPSGASSGGHTARRLRDDRHSAAVESDDRGRLRAAGDRLDGGRDAAADVARRLPDPPARPRPAEPVPRPASHGRQSAAESRLLAAHQHLQPVLGYRGAGPRDVHLGHLDAALRAAPRQRPLAPVAHRSALEPGRHGPVFHLS